VALRRLVHLLPCLALRCTLTVQTLKNGHRRWNVWYTPTLLGPLLCPDPDPRMVRWQALWPSLLFAAAPAASTRGLTPSSPNLAQLASLNDTRQALPAWSVPALVRRGWR
jgi:hypothetical protein